MAEVAEQVEMLPGAAPALDELDLATINRFATWVGGDATSIKTRVVAGGYDAVIERQGRKYYRIADLFAAFSKENQFQRRARVQADEIELRVRKQRGQLLDALDVEQTIGHIAQLCVKGLDANVDRIERRCGLTPAQAAELERCNDDAKREISAAVVEWSRARVAALPPEDQEESAAADESAPPPPMPASVVPPVAASSAVDEAVAFLREMLAGGPRATAELIEEARARGLSEATLRRAKAQMGAALAAKKIGRAWSWQLAQS